MGTSGGHRDAEIGLLTDEVKPKNHNVAKTTWRTAAISLISFLLILGIIFAFLHEDSVNNVNNLHSYGDDQPLDVLSLIKEPLNVLIIGDWGRNGQDNQTLVARQMSRVGKELELDFIISTGDNFYEAGLTSVDDANFEKSFTDVYHAKSLQKRWYAVLGNHDYRGNEAAEVDKSLVKRDPRWSCDYFYTITANVGPSSTVEFFMIDTNPFVENYWKEKSKYKWTRPTPREEVIATTLASLSSALENSAATWKIVVGHHTMYSYGAHRDTPEIIEKVLPILEANSVDLYINGHDHCLEHIKRDDSDIHFITSGGGSRAWKNEFAPDVHSRPDVELYYDGQGFISLSASATEVHVYFFDIFGTILHKLDLQK